MDFLQKLQNISRLTFGYFMFMLLSCFELAAQPIKILHYTETSGFDHQTRNVSLNMFELMGLQHGFTVDQDTSGDTFNSLSNLQQYDIVIFSNTTGDAILDSAQRQHFEQYVNGGGNFIGIHSATDTYRHSTANGSNTGLWDWYAELVGASVQQNPNHVNGTPVYTIETLISHPTVSGIPNPWNKAEEYYYWESGYFNSTNIILQRVEQTVGPNGQVNSYDSARAVSWYRELPAGGRVFYTSLGHDISNYTSDSLFYLLLENAVLWEGNLGSGVAPSITKNEVRVFPNPFHEKLNLKFSDLNSEYQISILTLEGKVVKNIQLSNEMPEINTSSLNPGIYLLEIKAKDKIIHRYKIEKY